MGSIRLRVLTFVLTALFSVGVVRWGSDPKDTKRPDGSHVPDPPRSLSAPLDAKMAAGSLTVSKTALSVLENPWLKDFSALAVSQQRPLDQNDACSSKVTFDAAESSWPVQCPGEAPEILPELNVPFSVVPSPNVDQDPRWVRRKYELYASRCAKTDGMMWSKLSRSTHDEIAGRVANITGMYSIGRHARALRLLDWASGCGVSLSFFRREMAAHLPGVAFEGLGVDITAAAVMFARNQSPGLGSVVHCVADGTLLHTWLPPSSFDVITSFGGLLHVPAAAMCRTLQSLLDLLRPGRVLWAGYIDSAATISQMLACNVTCTLADPTGSSRDSRRCDVSHFRRSIEAVVAPENKWLRSVGVPAANRKRRPHSVFFVKAEDCQA
jgi:hypothetical protein